MGFQDKEGEPLIKFKDSEGAFDDWKRVSKGRPCDYSGMTYDKLTNGSGIQWPCNEQFPNGKERLFEDGIFLYTGGAISEDQYRAMNPNGRAILKSGDYIPALDAVSDEYPFQLSTGRRTFHFHTRTKTGRSKALQEACPEPVVEINQQDADKLEIKSQDMVIVSSRRGKIELAALVSEIEPGQLFIPFHFGYFDSNDHRSRAANELTQEQWDAVSKQPMLKSGAVRVEKSPKSNGEVEIHIREEQSAAVARLEENHANAATVGDTRTRQRHLEYWLSATYEGFAILQDIWTNLLGRLVSDPEIVAATSVLRQMTMKILDEIRPQIEKYGEHKAYGHNISSDLKYSLFPSPDVVQSSYEALVTLQSLHIFLSHLSGLTTALNPAAQAMQDTDLLEAVQFASTETGRMQVWVTGQMGLRSPQTLIVPSIDAAEGLTWMSADHHTRH